mmetsp:Transcript_14280/g.60160  ORF Transcript_14280/g.60160 Transcript_14280/m.60160 type:complete len:238 (-) Transcript_14280:1016-1729(-)
MTSAHFNRDAASCRRRFSRPAEDASFLFCFSPVTAAVAADANATIASTDVSREGKYLSNGVPFRLVSLTVSSAAVKKRASCNSTALFDAETASSHRPSWARDAACASAADATAPPCAAAAAAPTNPSRGFGFGFSPGFEFGSFSSSVSVVSRENAPATFAACSLASSTRRRVASAATWSPFRSPCVCARRSMRRHATADSPWPLASKTRTDSSNSVTAAAYSPPARFASAMWNRVAA